MVFQSTKRPTSRTKTMTSFPGAASLNSTEEMEKSSTPFIVAESLNGITPMPQLAPKNEDVSSPSLQTTSSQNSVPDALVYKYNRYCDRIYERIGAILKQSYDPVNVRLSTSITTKQGGKKNGQKKKKKSMHYDLDRIQDGNISESEPKARTNCNESIQSKECSVTVSSQQSKSVQVSGAPSASTTSTSASHKLRQNQHHHQHHNKNTAVRRKANITKQKIPAKSVAAKPQQQVINRARGTLHGLSTIKRHGNVRVTPMSDYMSVRSNFVLGPLVLRVEKSFGRGAKRETKRATATTTQMIGRINLRVAGNNVTLHSIKVQQPKQVKVDSADNHDRTRKFVWQKSSHIAQVVSQKLASVAQTFLQ